jgi:imidazole glycerol-phosphate synthase subunit HisH
MIGLIDYGMGNLSSVNKALKAVGAIDVKLISTPEEIDIAEAIILPGVGNFGDGMKNLEERGLAGAIQNAVSFGKPFLGICLGMQLLMQDSEEAPSIKGLEVFEGSVVKFSSDLKLKVPQMGWNSVCFREPHQCIEGIKNREYFYFVHSYYVKPVNNEIVLGETDYGVNFCSCIAQNNVFATQFHPEKSQDAGLKILRNFVEAVQA